MLAALAAMMPWELGEKADPFAPAYANIRPEWYYVFMFQTLKLVPGGEIMGVEYEAIPILLFSLAGALLLVVPFLDRGRSRGWAIGGIIGLAFVVAMTCWGYGTLVPLYVVFLTGAPACLRSSRDRLSRDSTVVLRSPGVCRIIHTRSHEPTSCKLSRQRSVYASAAPKVRAFRDDVPSEVGCRADAPAGILSGAAWARPGVFAANPSRVPPGASHPGSAGAATARPT